MVVSGTALPVCVTEYGFNKNSTPTTDERCKTVLDEIANANFPEEDARATVYSVIWHLEALALTPHKTQGTSGVGSIKIHIPESVEIHIGTLCCS